MKNKWLLLSFSLISGMILIFFCYTTLFQHQSFSPKANKNEPDEHQKSSDQLGDIKPVNQEIGGHFELNDHNGKTFNSESLKGNYSFVFFGFTHCPDSCPTALKKLENIIQNMSKYGYNNFKALFITIDPERDSVEHISNFLEFFPLPAFIGLTGKIEQIQEVAKKFKVFYEVVDIKDPNYMVNHTAFIYFMDKEFNFVRPFDFQASEEEITNFLIKFVRSDK